MHSTYSGAKWRKYTYHIIYHIMYRLLMVLRPRVRGRIGLGTGGASGSNPRATSKSWVSSNSPVASPVTPKKFCSSSDSSSSKRTMACGSGLTFDTHSGKRNEFLPLSRRASCCALSGARNKTKGISLCCLLKALAYR